MAGFFRTAGPPLAGGPACAIIGATITGGGGAHGSKADQQNRVLMMSDTAQGDANPLLLIDENDVIAAHAASVGPVDPIQMNYLMSRGIPYAQAERMVIHGFLDPVLGAIPKGKVKDRMLAISERKLINGQRSYYKNKK